MVFKFISRYLGKFLIFISILIFIASFIVLALANNIDVLKSSLNSEDILEEIIQIDSDLTFDEIKTLCKQNPTEGDCEIIQNPSKLFDEPLDELTENITSNTDKIILARTASIIVFVLGIILLYLGTLSIAATGFKASITMFFSTLPYVIILYFSSKLASSDIIASLAPKMEGEQVSEKLLEITINAAKSWFEAAIQEIQPLLITLIAISLPLAIIFYILKRKQSKKSKP